MNREETLIKITIKLINFLYSENLWLVKDASLSHLSNVAQSFSKCCRLE